MMLAGCHSAKHKPGAPRRQAARVRRSISDRDSGNRQEVVGVRND